MPTCERCLAAEATQRCGPLFLCPPCASRQLQSKKKVKKKQRGDAVAPPSDRPVLAGTAALRGLANEQFCTYYKQQLGYTDDEWAIFEECMRQPLPVTWRFSGHDDAARALRDDMERALFPALVEQPTALSWYPGRLAWQSGVSRAALRGKDWDGADAPGGGGRPVAVKALHSWLLRETELGRVQRQESASMVPPLLLDVQPGHKVLDLCASPGSKTQQFLEMLEGSGLVVANDADTKRCQLLAARATRLQSTALVVINHDARLLPERLGARAAASLSSASAAAADGTAHALHVLFGKRPLADAALSATSAPSAPLADAPMTAPSPPSTALQFDRVLADVPCSGDGTMRKNPLIWKVSARSHLEDSLL